MDMCPTCQDSLRESVVAEVDGEHYKSCPSCSCKSGYHVFYRYGDFGMRNMGDGRYIVQSWCPGCRLEQGAYPPVAFTC